MAKKICLDAGHYGKYNQSPCNSKYYESQMNWKLHLLLKKYLEAYGFEVIQTRQDQAKDLAVYDRGTCGKGCDLLLSVHSNAVDSKVHDDIDYPVAYVPISGKGDALGKKLSECVRSVMGTKQKAEYWSKKGSNGDYYGVIRGATAVGTVGIILEHSFHTNTRSTAWLMDDANLDEMARAEAKVLAEHFGMTKPEEPEDGVLYCVQVGAYSVKANAEAQLAKVKAAGFTDAFITTTGSQAAAEPEPVKPAPEPAKPVVAFKVGDKVKLTSDATMYGKSTKFKSWVYSSTLYVRQVSGDRIVVSTVKVGAVTGAVNKKHLVHA